MDNSTHGLGRVSSMYVGSIKTTVEFWTAKNANNRNISSFKTCTMFVKALFYAAKIYTSHIVTKI